MTAPFPSPTATWHATAYPSISPTLPALSAAGKTILITGGGTGIGAETARSFAAAGASRIALLGRREAPLLETKASIETQYPSVEVIATATDVTRKSAVDAAFAAVAGRGAIDVLVSNAATIGNQDGVAAIDTEDFLSAVSINLRGTLNVAKAFLQHAAPNAVVIEVNSSAAHLNFADKFAAYSVAKLGVFRLWDSLASANPRIAVFHVHPGIVDTAMNRESGGVATVGHEDHVSLSAGFNVWLASPEARFLKGKFLWANWDVDELKARAKELEESSQLSMGLGGWPFEGNWTSNWTS